ncbi:MAG: hypothetical protein K5682_05245 [Lachnospiraceae bacterium]|nr:hypothetical protein [Lachnospiraceae bacterium]
MSKIKALIPVLLLAAVFFLIPGTKLAANAATTYCVGYDSSKGQWMYEPGNKWGDSDYHRELYYLKQYIKDGDLLVVYGEGKANLELDVDVNLSNLTVYAAKPVVIYANTITDCYILDGSIASVNGTAISNATVYNGATANLNGPVQNLYVHATGGQTLYCNVSASGTVAFIRGENDYQTLWQFFNVAAGKTSVVNGTWKTDAAYYSTTGTTPTTKTTASASSGTVDFTGVDITPVFDVVYYANRYPDLASAGIKTAEQLRAHFLSNGMKEGRQGCSGFNVHVYKANYKDLVATYAENLPGYYLHYCTNGYTEGRNAKAVIY